MSAGGRTSPRRRLSRALSRHPGVQLGGLLSGPMLWLLVVRPIGALSRFTDRVSLGELDIAESTRNSRDEIGVLAKSIGRMRTSLVKAMKMLDS